MNKDQPTRRSSPWGLNGHSHQGEPHYFSATQLHDTCRALSTRTCSANRRVPCGLACAAANTQLLSHKWLSGVSRRHLTAPSPSLHSKSKTFLLGGLNNLLILSLKFQPQQKLAAAAGALKCTNTPPLGWSLLESALAQRPDRSTFSS